MQSIVIAIHLMLVIAMIGVVLLQKSEGGGFVSTSSGFMTGRGTANVLTRTTALLAAGFFITSLALSLLAGHARESGSLIPNSPTTTEQPAKPGAPPPVTPFNAGKGGLLNQLGGNKSSANAPQAPSAPAPSGPQIPQSH